MKASESVPPTPPIAATILVQRIGPYHHARFEAAARAGDNRLTALEYRNTRQAYAWEEVTDPACYERSRPDTPQALVAALAASRPDVLVCVGYADQEIHCAMRWATRHRVPMVLCSDSTWEDVPRTWLTERLKRELATHFQAGLVAGSRSRKYLEQLGLPPDRLFAPWDVVDNAYFARGARADGSAMNESPYFLCVARFIPKKNLPALLRAYAAYVTEAGGAAWPLHLSGSGELEPVLREQIAATGLQSKVRLTGFVQYPALPGCYAGAGALILPSLTDQWGLVVNEAMAAGLPVLVSDRCGCAADLVKEGENGFTFDPHDEARMTKLLFQITAMTADERAGMGRQSQRLVAAYSPEAFAAGLRSATVAARRHRIAPSWVGRLLLNLSLGRTG